jgi:multiple antibiotic resistance protein
LAINIVIDYIVLRYLDKISHWLGPDIIYVLRKFFGVILLAMAIKLFSNNILAIIHQVP